MILARKSLARSYHIGSLHRVQLLAQRKPSISVTATPRDPWISVNPSTPTTSGPIAVTVNPAGLAAGTYQGTITLSASGGSSGTLPTLKQLPVMLYVDQPANPQMFSVPSGMSFLDSPIPPGVIFSVFGADIGPSVPVNVQVQSDQTLTQSPGRPAGAGQRNSVCVDLRVLYAN